MSVIKWLRASYIWICIFLCLVHKRTSIFALFLTIRYHSNILLAPAILSSVQDQGLKYARSGWSLTLKLHGAGCMNYEEPIVLLYLKYCVIFLYMVWKQNIEITHVVSLWWLVFRKNLEIMSQLNLLHDSWVIFVNTQHSTGEEYTCKTHSMYHWNCKDPFVYKLNGNKSSTIKFLTLKQWEFVLYG